MWLGLRTHNKTADKVNPMVNAIWQFMKEDEGAAAGEYALLVALITLGIVGAVTLLGTNITTALTSAANTIVAPAS